MKIAAIDIGSNAARLQITKLIAYKGNVTFKKLEYIRFPLRLGTDVFYRGVIGPQKTQELLKLMSIFKGLIDLYEIDHYFGCATSAMREASNGKKVAEDILNSTGLKIDIISGDEEAEMVMKVIHLYVEDDTYLHIDVGGGSTELNLFKNHKKMISESFDIGSVRQQQFGNYTSNWRACIDWIHHHVRKPLGYVPCIGTGGNINKINELSGGNRKKPLSLTTLSRTRDMIDQLSLEDRLNRLELNPDRAEVIVPAADIYIEVMRAARSRSIMVPMVGLKDGINYMLYEQHYQDKGSVVVKN